MRLVRHDEAHFFGNEFIGGILICRLVYPVNVYKRMLKIPIVQANPVLVRLTAVMPLEWTIN